MHQAILNGNIRLSGNNASVSALSARLGISKLSFSDASGLHAGEGIDLQLDADAQQNGMTGSGGAKSLGQRVKFSGNRFISPEKGIS